MRVVCYPADRYGCGHHRVIWPAEVLAAAGHDVIVVTPEQRHLRLLVDRDTDQVREVQLPDGTDVVVLQRVTHRYLAEAVPVMRAAGVTVVVDVDDDLAAVHPANPAWTDLHPHREKFVKTPRDQPHMHSWHHLAAACRDATLVTATTPALLKRYAAHGRGRLLPNYLADHYYGIERVDSDLIGWPAALHSHPDDPPALGNAVARLVNEGFRFKVTSVRDGVAAAFGLTSDDQVERIDGPVDLLDWPRVVAEIGVGVAPLADTRFNESKSWLKGLELAAVGVPWVGSPRAEYTRLSGLGCGLLAEKSKQWYRLLRDLATNAERRRELSEAGRAVAETLRLRDHAWRWWEAWDDALAVGGGSVRERVVV